MSRAAVTVWAVAGVLAGALAGFGSVAAQPTKLPESMTKASLDMRIIARQLRTAKQFGTAALQAFEVMPRDGMIVSAQSLDPATVRATRDTYVMIRVAKTGLDFRRDRQKYQDPVLELTYKTVFDAWTLARTAPGALSSSMPRSKYLPLAIRDTKRALQLIDQALILMP